MRFQKGNLTLPLHSCQHLEHAIQVKKKPFGSQVVAKQVELQKKMMIVKTRLEKRLPEIFNCLVFRLRSERLLVTQ